MNTIVINNNYIDQFSEFIEKLSNFDKNTTLWNFIIESIKNNDPEVAVACQFVDEKIIGFGVGYSLNSYWKRKNALPYWVMGRHQKLNNNLTNFDLEQIPIVLTAHFEKLGFYSFYMVNKISNNKITYSNCEQVYQRFIKRAFNIERYDFSIEKILYHGFDYDELSSLYKVITYQKCEPSESIIISKYNLKYQNRV